MAANAPQNVTVTCPACQIRYQASAQSIVDVGPDPRLKAMLLQGRLNVGICPNCGTTGMLSVPLAYHDPEKELLLTLVPAELRMNEDERQRSIGRMSNAIINSLPAEERKGYLLRPRMFLSFESMVEAILEADGITREMLEAQQAKIGLIRSMVEVVDDPLQLAALVGQHEEQIDYEFFALLSLQLRAAEQQEQEEVADKLYRVREALLERTETGQEVAKQQEAMEAALAG
ncbi:MAG TPA: CpXC domain-containing protein, partial [Anaerolineae bacterium]|nr:CpXC domain-containing protein [Anaerolineae bacterium]